MVALAWLLTDCYGEILKSRDYLIKPDGWSIEGNKFLADHGYTQEELEANGQPVTDVLNCFLEDLQESDYQIGHNIEYDIRMVNLEINIAEILFEKELNKRCTMRGAASYCNLKNKLNRLKPPTLDELYLLLFNKEIANRHTAYGDLIATKESYFELVHRGVFPSDVPA